jgi:hypothetical protein
MNKIRTYVDTSVLIGAFSGDKIISERAFAIITDLAREFVVSDYLRLESVSKPKFHRRQAEVDFYEKFFKSAARQVKTSPIITAWALNYAAELDIAAMDSLHLGVSKEAGVEEFITLEKSTKPMFKVKDFKVTSIL